MNSKTVLLFILLVMLPSAMLGARFIVPVEGAPGIIEVPGDYETIQAAIDAADPGDIIQVASETYYEHVVVNKSLTIVGEDRSTTIIDGNGMGIVVRSNVSDVEIRGFTVQNGGGEHPYGGIQIASCVRNTIRDCIIRYNGLGIELHESNDSIITGNNIMNNSWAGIYVRDSSNNEIHDNTIANNSMGVWITSESSLLNMFYHNNLIDNLSQASDFSLNTSWDNGAEGNYWSDYTGVDDGSDNRTAGDGIGDTLLPHEGKDSYPLMEPWSQIRVFNAGTWNGVTYYVTTFSNSTVATKSFNFSIPLKRISFNVTSGASGFCNVTIPKRLLNSTSPEEWVVMLDDSPISASTLDIVDNATHTFLYFTYSPNIHNIKIIGTNVIPEFPWSISMPIFLVALAILLVFIRRRSRVFK